MFGDGENDAMTGGDGEDTCIGDGFASPGVDSCAGGNPPPPPEPDPQDPDQCADDIEAPSGCWWKGQNT
jgi:hypothetical protein